MPEESVKMLRLMPLTDHIFEFIYAIYDVAKFSHECCIISTIYMFRFIKNTKMPLLPTSWRPLSFICLLIAQKIMDDTCIKNVDFRQIYPFFTLQEVNILEEIILKNLDYDMHIGL